MSASQRNILEAAGGAGLLTTAAAAFKAPGARGSAPGPNADLLRDCDEFAGLSRRLEHIYNVEFLLDVGDGSEAAAEPLRERLGTLLDPILAAQATTIEGFKARGRMLLAYQGDSDCFPQGPWPDSMLASLLNDLTAGDDA